jgi:hypothetical protein
MVAYFQRVSIVPHFAVAAVVAVAVVVAVVAVVAAAAAAAAAVVVPLRFVGIDCSYR